ncbi:MAG: hypothetical protein A3D35_02510 [Candidatus Staskawiczbacteria bacterium RIFCSPHIGHO2_02_FULL_34_9]|uniref:Uncharacterized protein n=1 Tax=Candidatus Staskawiczbacteria bacterium RIFCSPHIGHO2_02_FULL_34_9 TaxID=1802206 RepID=A0A1G2HYT5_9BACT|nr:MAG: hypothetical protein A3D35_02510 [Candidatus Staskawiczbacteria bacterium RIFCSPHIGHO2_02_FULL_34_9]
MRLGEIKQKIDRVISEEKIIQIKNEPLYEGRAQKVLNYSEIVDVLEQVSSLSWSEVKEDEITEQLLKQYPGGNSFEILPQTEFDKFSSYVNNVNKKLPVYYSILETMVKKQDEQTINIKLPEDVKTLADLDKLNKSLTSLFKKFNLAGEFQFQGFDVGTSWYEILITAKILYNYFISCLDVALRIVNLKKTYYESVEAKINYKASLRDAEKETKEGLKEYVDKYTGIFLEEKIKEVIEEIGEMNGKTKPEITSNLIMATKELVKELGEGVEFHLSFNPPAYAEERGNGLKIDYKKIQMLNQKSEEAIKELESGKAEEVENEENNSKEEQI